MLSSILACSKFSINQGRREGAEACILYKPSIERSRKTISVDGEIGFCINNSFQEAKALLPSTCNCYYDGSSTQEVNEQVGSRKTIDLMGYQA